MYKENDDYGNKLLFFVNTKENDDYGNIVSFIRISCEDSKVYINKPSFNGGQGIKK